MNRYLLTTISLIFIISTSCTEHRLDNQEIDGPTTGRVIHVPADQANLANALSSAVNGDTILLADGIYSGDDNRDLIISSKSVVIKSENGPAYTKINIGGDSLDNHFGLEIKYAASSNIIIDGITFKNGYSIQAGAIRFFSTSPVIKNCIFTSNSAIVSGGAIRCKGSSPQFINCTFVNNKSPVGASLMLIANSQPTLTNCIIAYSQIGESIRCNDNTSIPILYCCNIFDNEGGDWSGCLENQFDSLTNLNGNIMIDPMFCDIEGSLYLSDSSVCLPDNNSCSVLIGALASNCGNSK